MSLAFKLMTFVLLFNLSTGFLSYVVGESIQGVNNDQWVADQANINTQFGTSTQLQTYSPTSTSFFALMDLLSLGLFSKLQTLLNSTLYAIPTILLNIGLITEPMRYFIDALLTIIYTLGIIELFTGKRVTS